MRWRRGRWLKCKHLSTVVSDARTFGSVDQDAHGFLPTLTPIAHITRNLPLPLHSAGLSSLHYTCLYPLSDSVTLRYWLAGHQVATDTSGRKWDRYLKNIPAIRLAYPPLAQILFAAVFCPVSPQRVSSKGDLVYSLPTLEGQNILGAGHRGACFTFL